MVYKMLDKTYVGEGQVDSFISLVNSRFRSLHPMEYLHGIAAIGGRLYADGKEAELEPV